MSNRHEQSRRAIAVLGATFCLVLWVGCKSLSPAKAAGAAGGANELYVSPDGQASNRGTADSPWSLSKANASVRPGDVIVLEGGTYRTPIRPASSGTEGRQIVYRAAPGAKPLLTGMRTAIDLGSKSYIAIEGIAVEKVGRFVYAQSASHLRFVSCRFDTARQWESCRFRTMGDCVTIKNCVIRNGSDSVMIECGRHHLIEGNTFYGASHTCLVLIGVKESVVRDNHLVNPRQKCMEVFTTRARRKIPKVLSEHNLIEDNIFGPSPVEGIQYGGNRSILRRNVFVGDKTGMSWSNYVSKKDYPEAWYNKGNRFYNNVLYDNGTAVLLVTQIRSPAARGKGLQFGDNVMMNNILYHNKANRGRGCAPSVQVAFDWDAIPQDAGVFYNCILGSRPGLPAMYWCDAKRHAKSLPLAQWQALYPRWANHNIEADPQFVAADKGDFHLRPTSPCIDAGGFLTRTASAGRGRVVGVLDAGYFCDGFGLVEGDTIRIGAQRAKVVHVDYKTNELTLDRELSWSQGEGVSLDYLGKAPDMGIFETR